VIQITLLCPAFYTLLVNPDNEKSETAHAIQENVIKNCLSHKILPMVAFVFVIVPTFLPAQDALPSAPVPIAPLTVRQKLGYTAVETIGPYKIAETAAVAGYNQWTDFPSEWGQGADAYGKRFVSEYGYVVVRQTLEFGLELGLHQDPRYFPTHKRGFFNRTGSALVQTFVARSDAGTNQFAWSRMGSAAGSAGIGNIWQPASTHTVGYAMESFGWILGGDAGYNWVQEFFPFFRPRSVSRF
jgi:hypothetical protein